MPNCKDVARLVASDELGRQGIVTRLMVGLHFRMCRCCPHYVWVLQKTLTLFKEKHARPIPSEEVRRLSDSITRRLLTGS